MCIQFPVNFVHTFLQIFFFTELVPHVDLLFIGPISFSVYVSYLHSHPAPPSTTCMAQRTIHMSCISLFLTCIKLELPHLLLLCLHNTLLRHLTSYMHHVAAPTEQQFYVEDPRIARLDVIERQRSMEHNLFIRCRQPTGASRECPSFAPVSSTHDAPFLYQQRPASLSMAVPMLAPSCDFRHVRLMTSCPYVYTCRAHISHIEFEAARSCYSGP